MDEIGRKRKIVQTLLLFSGFVAVGLAGSVIGPTLLDLEKLTHSRTDQISVVFILRAFGGLSGGLVSAFLMSRSNEWVLLAVAASMLGTMQILMPLCRNLVSLGVVMTLRAFCNVLFSSPGNMYLIKMWGADHKPWMHALHFLYGIGTLLGPLLAAPFLSSKQENKSWTTNTTDPVQNTTSNEDQSANQVKYVFFITGGFLLVHCIIFFILFVLDGRSVCVQKIDKTEDQIDTKDKLSNYNKPFLISFVTLIFVLFWMYCVLEATFATYLTTYTVDELDWCERSGAKLTSLFWTTFTIGRGTGIFVSKVLKPKTILIFVCILTMTSLFPAVFFAHYSDYVMWVCTGLLGLGLSTIYASGLSFANVYVPISGGLGALFIAGGALGDLTGPAFIIPFFDTYGMQVFVVLLFVASIVMFLVFLCALVIGKRHGERTEEHSEKLSLLPAKDE